MWFFFPFKLYFHKFYICLLFLVNYISKVNLVVVYFFLESYPWFFRYCPWFLKPREPGATFKNKLSLVPARLFQGLAMIKSDVINDTFMQVDLTRDCYHLFLELWKIAPGPSKIAPGSGKIMWTRSNFYKGITNLLLVPVTLFQGLDWLKKKKPPSRLTF